MKPDPTANWDLPDAHDGPLFTDPAMLEMSLPLCPGKPRLFMTRSEDGGYAAAAYMATRGPARALFPSTLLPTANSHVPMAGVTGTRITTAMLEDLADQVFAASWDRLDIGPYPDCDPVTMEFAQICRARAARHQESVNRIYSIENISTSDELLQAQSANSRKNLRRLLKKMDGSDEYTVEHLTGPDAMSGLQRFIGIDNHSWKSTDGESIDVSPILHRFYEQLFARFVPNGQIMVTILNAAGVDIAGTIALLYNGMGYTYKASYLEDRAYEKLSPGALCNFLTLRWLLETAGLSRISLLSSSDYAKRLSNSSATTTACRIWHPRLRTRPLIWAGLAKSSVRRYLSSNSANP